MVDLRPMASATDALWSRIPTIPINYERPLYENVSDVQNVATAAQRIARPNFHLIVPRGGHVGAQVTVADGAPISDAETIFNLTRVLLNTNSKRSRETSLTSVPILGAKRRYFWTLLRQC